MQARLSAEVLGSGAQAVARIPTGQAQFTILLVGHEPVICLPLFIPAQIARNSLPDHDRPFASPLSHDTRRAGQQTPASKVKATESALSI